MTTIKIIDVAVAASFITTGASVFSPALNVTVKSFDVVVIKIVVIVI